MIKEEQRDRITFWPSQREMCFFFFFLLWTAGLLLAQVRLAINLTIKGQAYPEVSSIDKTSCLGFYSEVATHCGAAHRQCSLPKDVFTVKLTALIGPNSLCLLMVYSKLGTIILLICCLLKYLKLCLWTNIHPSIYWLALIRAEPQGWHIETLILFYCIYIAIDTFVFSLSGWSYFEALIVLYSQR